MDDATWRRMAPAFLDRNYMQTPRYASAYAARFGATAEGVAVLDGDEPAALALVRTRSVPVIGGGVAYVAGGPLLRREGATAASFGPVFEALEGEYLRRRGMVLRVMCQPGPAAWDESLRTTLADRGYRPARWPREYQTTIVSLDRPLEEIRSSISKNWRKSLTRGERKGVTVRETAAPADFAIATRMHEELIERKGFSTDVDASLFEALQREAREGDERFLLHIAEFEGEPVGMNLMSELGDTLLGIIGAVTPTGREVFASYVLEWAAIERGHARGMRGYDLGGIDPEGNPGVASFKRGLRGDEVAGVGPLERRPSGARGAALAMAETAVRRMKRLRATAKGGA